METLIELYDERPLENVLGVEMFRPARVVYVCPDQIASDLRIQQKLRQYFQHRGIRTELIFLRARVFDTEAMLNLFKTVSTISAAPPSRQICPVTSVSVSKTVS